MKYVDVNVAFLDDCMRRIHCFPALYMYLYASIGVSETTFSSVALIYSISDMISQICLHSNQYTQVGSNRQTTRLYLLARTSRKTEKQSDSYTCILTINGSKERMLLLKHLT